jgi:ribosomal protein S18 acetylase RimI-like enzyme
MTSLRRLEPNDDLRDSVTYFTKSTGTDNGATFIASAKGRIVGYITVFVRTQAPFWKIKRVGAISGLMVCRDHRRQGIATRLLAEAIAFFQRREIKFFTTYTAVANDAAVRFFERNGMVPLHTTLIGDT